MGELDQLGHEVRYCELASDQDCGYSRAESVAGAFRAISEYQQAASAYNDSGDLAGLDRCTIGQLIIHALRSGDIAAITKLLERPIHTLSLNLYYRAQLTFCVHSLPTAPKRGKSCKSH